MPSLRKNEKASEWIDELKDDTSDKWAKSCLIDVYTVVGDMEFNFNVIRQSW
jgi:hypothetical protein